MARRFRVGLVFVLGTAAVGTIGMQAASADTASTAAAEFVHDINQLRASHGLGTLSVNSQLSSVAYNWSVHMAQAGSISHNPNLTSQAPANWQMLGENVGMGPDEPSLQQAFTNSPEHYANMVNSHFTEIGVGVVVAPNGTMFVTEDYMEPQAAPAPAPAPRPAPAPSAPHPSAPVAPAHAAAASPQAPAAPPAAAPAVAAAAKPAVIPVRRHAAADVSVGTPLPLPASISPPPTVPASASTPQAVGGVAAMLAPAAVLAFVLRRRRRS